MLFSVLGGFLPLVTLPAPPPVQEASEVAPISTEEFQELLQRLTPDADEAWRTLPWRIELLSAQREALAAQRPLFIWAMDGHPLGCT